MDIVIHFRHILLCRGFIVFSFVDRPNMRVRVLLGTKLAHDDPLRSARRFHLLALRLHSLGRSLDYRRHEREAEGNIQ
jgi:hypothetical protein